MSYTSEDLERIKTYEKVHMRGVDEDAGTDEKIGHLQKRDRRKWYMLIFNILVIFFFTYSYYFDLTALSDTIYILILVVFAINVLVIFLQKKQIRELIDFYHSS